MSKLNSVDHTCIGAFAGAVETCVNQPLHALKNVLQDGRTIPRNPLHYYRGLPLNVMMMTQLTASQFGANSFCQSLLRKLTRQELSNGGIMASAAAAGTLSAILASPGELVILQQQRTGQSMIQQIQSLYRTHGLRCFGRGFSMCAAREAFYTSGYLGLFPVLYSWLQSSSLEASYSQNTLFLTSGVAAGVFGSFFSQPFDTIKTRQQAFLYSNNVYLNSWTAVRTMKQNEGITTLWKGAFPRGLRIILAVFLLNEVRTRATQFLEGTREQNQPNLFS
eukprot:g764.t1